MKVHNRSLRVEQIGDDAELDRLRNGWNRLAGIFHDGKDTGGDLFVALSIAGFKAEN